MASKHTTTTNMPKVRCECCDKDTPKDKLVEVAYSLKRGATRPSEKWCKECYDEHVANGEICTMCGCNSYGSIPCAGCRRYYRM